MITNIESILLVSICTGMMVCASLSRIGSVVVWRGFGYVGEAISHASILGIILGLFFSINVSLAMVLFSCCFGCMIFFAKNVRVNQLVMLILSYGLLSLGMILLNLINYANIDIMTFLFGDILLVSNEDLVMSFILFCIISVWLKFRVKDLIYISLNEEMAKIEGVKVKQVDLEFILITSVLIGLSIKIIGVLLAASMLIIPASAASNISNSPRVMITKSTIIGIASLIFGCVLSIILDSATGPSIVLCSSIIFLITPFMKKK